MNYVEKSFNKLLENVIKCPAITLYIILQIVILYVDFFSKKDLVRAFVHFWLGFVFYLGYEKKLCVIGPNYLGAEQILMVLAFVFFQFFLINYAMDITQSSDNTANSVEERKERLNLEKRERELEFLKRKLELDHDNYKYIKVDANMNKNTVTIKGHKNIKKGDIITLKDGSVRIVKEIKKVGNKDGFVNKEGFINMEYVNEYLFGSVEVEEKEVEEKEVEEKEVEEEMGIIEAGFTKIKSLFVEESKTTLILDIPVPNNTQGYILIKDKNNKVFTESERLKKISTLNKYIREKENEKKKEEEEEEEEEKAGFSLLKGFINIEGYGNIGKLETKIKNAEELKKIFENGKTPDEVPKEEKSNKIDWKRSNPTKYPIKEKPIKASPYQNRPSVIEQTISPILKDINSKLPYLDTAYSEAAPHLGAAYMAALPHLSNIFKPQLFENQQDPRILNPT